MKKQCQPRLSLSCPLDKQVLGLNDRNKLITEKGVRSGLESLEIKSRQMYFFYRFDSHIPYVYEKGAWRFGYMRQLIRIFHSSSRFPFCKPSNTFARVANNTISSFL